VWKLAKVQLCDYNFNPPYHENTLEAYLCIPKLTPWLVDFAKMLLQVRCQRCDEYGRFMT
jgi:hypothetical protein